MRPARPYAGEIHIVDDKGGKAAAIPYGIAASAKADPVEPFAYVRDLLVGFSGDHSPNLSELLPKESL